jgi:hypothetical protein
MPTHTALLHRPLSVTSAALADAMAGAARRDVQAIQDLHTLLEPRLSRMIRADLRSFGVYVDADRLHDLVTDAFVSIVERAGQWRADGGAHPCQWARLSILAASRRSLGQFADEFDPERDDLVAPALRPMREAEILDLAEALAARHPAVRLLLDALATTSERDGRVFLRVAEEHGLHNPHAAVTVAVEEHINPAAVRQICRRARLRLAAAANAEAAYAPLLELPLLAA